MLNVKNLDIYYKNKYEKIYVLKNIQLDINTPSIYGILGPNGSGKTTLLKTLLDLHKDYNGTIKLFGEKLMAKNKNIFCRIGYAPEDFFFYKDFKAEDFLARFDLIGQNQIKSKQNIDLLLEKLDLISNKKSPISTLSKGMKKRLLIALSLLNDPDLLFLDEPFEGLDPLQKKNLRNIITKRLERGKTSIICSHEIDSIEKCCTHIGITSNGKFRNVVLDKDGLDLESIYEKIVTEL